MAYGSKCYCCWEKYPTDSNLYYCRDCLLKLEQAFASGRGVLSHPEHYDHCISCGGYENRRILYTGKTGLFPTHDGDGIPICEQCVQEELELNQ